MTMLFFLKPKHRFDSWVPQSAYEHPVDDKKKRKKKRRVFDIKNKKYEIKAREINSNVAAREVIQQHVKQQAQERVKLKKAKQLHQVLQIVQFLDDLEDFDL